MSGYDFINGNPEGAFKTYYRNSSGTLATGTGIGKWLQYTFNASNSNSIYDSSDMVTPLSLSAVICMKY